MHKYEGETKTSSNKSIANGYPSRCLMFVVFQKHGVRRHGEMMELAPCGHEWIRPESSAFSNVIIEILER